MAKVTKLEEIGFKWLRGFYMRNKNFLIMIAPVT